MENSNEGKTLLRLLGGVPAGNDDGIGANSQTIEYTENSKTTRILIDFGVKLPSDEIKKKHHEFTGIMPDFRRFFPGENGEPAELPLDAIAVTHAHADHLDGLIYMTLWAHAHKFKMPKIIGSQFTRNKLNSLLRQQNLPKGMFPEFEIMQPCKGKKIGKIEIISMPESHPTPGAYGYIFVTPTASYFNQGDNRMSPSHIGVGGNNQMTIGMLRKYRITHYTVDSTSSGMKPKEKGKDDTITFNDSLKAVDKIFSENRGKQVFSPTISRSIENWLPLLIKGREQGKKIFIDGYQARSTFRDWQEDNTVFYMVKGKLQSTKDIEFVEKLRAMGVETYCAKDFHKCIWDYDNITNADANKYIQSVGKKDRVVIISGAFAEASPTQVSGGVRLAKGEHKYFLIDKDTVIDGAQRIINSLSSQEVKNMYRGFLRQGAKVYLNELSREILEKDGDNDLLNACIFIKRQPSGHSDEGGTKENGDMIASNAKNFKDFHKQGLKLQALAIHGNEGQRQNSKKALAGDERIECHSFCNGDVVEHAPGVSKLIEHIDIQEQKFLGIINEPNCGEFVFKPLDGKYDESMLDDIVLPKLSQIPAREDHRTEAEINKARALEEEGGKGSMNKWIVKSGKNAGKSKKMPKTNEERRRNVEAKIARRAERQEKRKERKEARRQKINGFTEFEM